MPRTLALATIFFCLAGFVHADEAERIELPAFESRTVSVQGEAVAVDVRRFDPPFVVGTAVVERLVDSAIKSHVSAWRSLVSEQYAEFVEMAIDPGQAQQFADHIKAMSDEDRQAYRDRILAAHVIGEIRIGDISLVVWQNDDEMNVACLTFTEDGYRIIAVPYYQLETIDGLRSAMSIAELVRKGQFSLMNGTK